MPFVQNSLVLANQSLPLEIYSKFSAAWFEINCQLHSSGAQVITQFKSIYTVFQVNLHSPGTLEII